MAEKNTEKVNYITEEKESELEEFVDFARLIMGVLGHKVFEPLVKVTPAVVEQTVSKEDPILHFETKKVQATGRRVADGFVVLKGSKVDPSISKSCPSNVVEYRQKYSARIVDNVLTDDILLPSPSAAASFVSGSSRNGNITWKTVDRIVLGQLE